MEPELRPLPMRRGQGSLRASEQHLCRSGEASRRTGALSFPPQSGGKPSSFTQSPTSLGRTVDDTQMSSQQQQKLFASLLFVGRELGGRREVENLIVLFKMPYGKAFSERCWSVATTQHSTPKRKLHPDGKVGIYF